MPQRAPGVEVRALEEVMNALSASPNAERLAVPLLTDLKAIGVHVEPTVYAKAVETSVSRAGRNNAHPEKGAFQVLAIAGAPPPPQAPAQDALHVGEHRSKTHPHQP